ncbi:GTD2A protein, partial [Atractosteus spatula]|nr:GTD2A protein [Atractosteus spatula]
FLNFIRGINHSFKITEELLSMESIKGTMKATDLYDKVSACIDRMKLPWRKLINVTDGSTNLTGKNGGLLKRTQDKVKENDPEAEVIFLHYIIHQEALCKNVLGLDHVVKAIVKLVNFIRARGLNHRQFIQFLDDIGADHHDLLYHSNVCWKSLTDLHGEFSEFYASLNEPLFPHIPQAAQKILVLFGSTYMCEQTFSLMNINKSQLSDLSCVLWIATTQLSTDFDALTKRGDQLHGSH